jgi:hypothetical protein
MNDTKPALALFVVLIGCKPKGRNIEQHDVMFGVGAHIDDLSDAIKSFWYKSIVSEVAKALKTSVPYSDIKELETNMLAALSHRDKVHIDGWIKVNYVDGYKIIIRQKGEPLTGDPNQKLYFINLGGYKENEFEEFHKKLFVVATSVSEALGKVMHIEFMKDYSPIELGIAGSAHLDDQYKIGFEADDIVCISESAVGDYVLDLEPSPLSIENEMVAGYTHINYPD